MQRGLRMRILAVLAFCMASSASLAAEWIVERDTDKIDRSAITTASLEAAEATAEGGLGEAKTYLVFRCSQKKFEAFIATNQFLGISLGPIAATLRVGEQVTDVKVSLSKTSKAAFFSGSDMKRIVAAVSEKKEIAVRLKGPVSIVDSIFRPAENTDQAAAPAADCKVN